MRDKIFRFIAAVLFGLMCFVGYRVARYGLDFDPTLDDLYAIAGLLLIAPTFAVYALLGERAAYKVLIPGLALVRLPEIIWSALLRVTGGKLELPPEYLREPDQGEPEAD